MAKPRNWQIRLIQLLSIPGLLVAFYLLLFHSGAIITTCTVNELFDCNLVSGPQSPYATIGPIPIALLGLLGYSLIFLLAWSQDWLPLVDDYIPELMAGVAGLAFLFTLGLTALELFVIHAFCQYCLISAVLVTMIFLLAISYLRSDY